MTSGSVLEVEILNPCNPFQLLFFWIIFCLHPHLSFFWDSDGTKGRSFVTVSQVLDMLGDFVCLFVFCFPVCFSSFWASGWDIYAVLSSNLPVLSSAVESILRVLNFACSIFLTLKHLLGSLDLLFLHWDFLCFCFWNVHNFLLNYFLWQLLKKPCHTTPTSVSSQGSRLSVVWLFKLRCSLFLGIMDDFEIIPDILGNHIMRLNIH